jgi:hypothetical protein
MSSHAYVPLQKVHGSGADGSGGDTWPIRPTRNDGDCCEDSTATRVDVGNPLHAFAILSETAFAGGSHPATQNAGAQKRTGVSCSHLGSIVI